MSASSHKARVKQIVNKQVGSPAYIRGELFQQLKPFALFDAGRLNRPELNIDWHPHSGIATITFPYDADLKHADSQGNGGTVKSRGLQWMASGSGAWHKESYVAHQEHIGILQLWLLLPPQEELAAVKYFNIQPQDIPQVDNVRILLGEFNAVKAAIATSHNVSYLHISLKKYQHFHWRLPRNQSRGFIYPMSGALKLGEQTLYAEQFALLDEQSLTQDAELWVTAKQDSEFVLALVEPWGYPVVSHLGQIHTNLDALQIGKRQIQRLAKMLVGS